MADQAVKQDMTDEEFDRHVMAILARELGPGGYARYLSTYRSGPGDYTRDRHQWLSHLTVEDILSELSTKPNG